MDEDQFESWLGGVLRAGVLISAALVAWGGVIYLLARGPVAADYRVFTGEPAGLRSVTAIVSSATTLGGRELIQFGVLVLIATPIARVVFSVIGFARRRDWLYVGVSLLVLMLLTYSLTTS